MMKNGMMMAFAALAAFQAAAITATKEYVDRRDNEIRTNTYTKAETDARIVALAPPPADYANVSNRAMNAITRQEARAGFTEWNVSGLESGEKILSGPDYVRRGGNEWYWTLYTIDSLGNPHGYYDPSNDKNAIVLTFSDGRITATRIRLPTMADITNTVTKAYVEGLGIESGIQEESDPVWSSEKGNYATKQSVSVVSNLAASADTKANTAIDAVANADTSYPRYTTVTNLNQSVQFLNITNTEPSPLVIEMPTDGRTKDWIVYVYAATNVTLTLPSSMIYWMADVSYTNEVPPATPTAFYFSQISTNIFYLGRQELTEVAAP